MTVVNWVSFVPAMACALSFSFRFGFVDRDHCPGVRLGNVQFSSVFSIGFIVANIVWCGRIAPWFFGGKLDWHRIRVLAERLSQN